MSIADSERLSQNAANLAAVQRVEAWLDASIEVYQTIGVETVLSSPKYQRLVGSAQARGFEVRMIYVTLRTAEEQLARIRIRVSEGGHDVPEDKVRARRKRSFEQLAWFARHVDRLFLFDNSGGEPVLMASGLRNSGLVWHRRPPAALRAELAAAGVEGLPLAQGSAKSRR